MCLGAPQRMLPSYKVTPAGRKFSTYIITTQLYLAMDIFKLGVANGVRHRYNNSGRRNRILSPRETELMNDLIFFVWCVASWS